MGFVDRGHMMRIVRFDTLKQWGENSVLVGRIWEGARVGHRVVPVAGLGASGGDIFGKMIGKVGVRLIL